MTSFIGIKSEKNLNNKDLNENLWTLAENSLRMGLLNMCWCIISYNNLGIDSCHFENMPMQYTVIFIVLKK